MAESRYIQKQLAGKEDLLLGIGTVSQARASGTRSITKLNVSELQGALVVENLAALNAIDVTMLTEKTAIVKDLGVMTYNSTTSVWECASANVDTISVLKTLQGGEVNLLGYHEKGDGGGGLFYWDGTSVEADNGGTIIEATGIATGRWKRVYSGAVNVKWFGAKGDGIADDTGAIQSAINISGSILCDGKFKLTNKIISNGKSIDINAKNAEFVFYNSDGGFEIIGGWDNIQYVSMVSGRDFTVSDSTSYQVGQLIKIVDEQALPINPDNSLQGEFAIISAISGNILTMAADTYNIYDPLHGCKLGLLKELTININIGTIRYDDSVSTSTLELVYLEAVKGATVNINNQKQTLRGGLCMVSCFGCSVTVNTIKNDLPSPSGNYGIVVTNSEFNNYKIGSFYGGRHALDGISQQRGMDLSKYGATAYNKGTGAAFGTDEAAFSFHHGAHDNVYHDTLSKGCAGHTGIRGVNNTVTNPTSINDILPFSAFQQDDVPNGITSGTKVINPIVYNATGKLIQLADNGGTIDVIGGTFDASHDSFTSMLNVGAGGKLKITGTSFNERGSVSTRCISIISEYASEVELNDVVFNFRNCVLEGTFSLIDNFTTHSAGLIIKVNNITVLSNEPIHEFYDSIALPAIGSYIGNLRFDYLTYLNAQFRVGTDQAVPAFSGYIKGQIVVGFKQIADANLLVAVTYSPPSLNAGATSLSSGFAVKGASTDDFVYIAPPYDLQGIIAYGYVNAANSVRIRLYNPTTGVISLASGVWKIKISKG